MGKKTSVVWQYFDVVPGGLNCKIADCPAPFVVCASKSTSGQWNHLETNHSAIYEQLKPQKQPPKRKMPTDEGKFDPPAVSVKRSKTDEAESEVMKMLARRNIPFALVDDHFFQELVAAKYKGINLHGSRHYAVTVLPRVANDLLKKLREEIGERHFAITTDGWSAQNKPSPSLYR